MREGDPRELRALGKALKPNAHELAKHLLHFAAASERNEGDPVLIPPNLLSEAVLLLLALAGPQRGAPRKDSTNQALELVAQHGMRKAARLIAKSTGENPENLRARLYGIKRRARKRKQIQVISHR